MGARWLPTVLGFTGIRVEGSLRLTGGLIAVDVSATCVAFEEEEAAGATSDAADDTEDEAWTVTVCALEVGADDGIEEATRDDVCALETVMVDVLDPSGTTGGIVDPNGSGAVSLATLDDAVSDGSAACRALRCVCSATAP